MIKVEVEKEIRTQSEKSGKSEKSERKSSIWKVGIANEQDQFNCGYSLKKPAKSQNHLNQRSDLLLP